MSLKTVRSTRLKRLAERLMPGGVNSPVRSYSAVGGSPVFVSRGKGAYVFDEDGNRYIDYIASWGPLILGHAHRDVVRAIKRAAEGGTSFGASCEKEIELSELIVRTFPSVDMVRMTSSGTEATMSAVRVARAFTGRDLIVKFEGCYHGHADYLLVKAGSGATTFGTPSSPGVPKGFTSSTLLARFNNVASVERLFKKNKDRIAAVIIEPVAANMGVVKPAPGFLEALRSITADHGAVLIFDEVISGFRLGLGGAQEFYGVKPDLTCLGKIIGGGLPVGAYGGKREIMKMVAPIGPVYQAGTLSGNPLSMAAGIATVNGLRKGGTYQKLNEMTRELVDGAAKIFKQHGVNTRINSIGSMFTIFFTGSDVFDYESALRSDTKIYARFFKSLLKAGIMFPPSQFEAVFVSLAHKQSDISRTLDVISRVAKSL